MGVSEDEERNLMFNFWMRYMSRKVEAWQSGFYSTGDRQYGYTLRSGDSIPAARRTWDHRTRC